MRVTRGLTEHYTIVFLVTLVVLCDKELPCI